MALIRRLLTLTIFGCAGFGQTFQEFTQLLDPLIERQLAEREIAGAVVAIVAHGQPVYVRGYGRADVAAGRAMTTATPIQLASVTKLFTAIAVMQLVEAGRLDLDADVNRYLDFSIPPSSASQPATLRRLLSHQEGFEYWTRGIASPQGERQPLGSFLSSHLPHRLTNPSPGAYSNYSAAVAAYAVERASGEPFEEYLERHVFAPLHLDHTSARQPPPPQLLPSLSSGYFRSTQPPTPISMATATIHEAGSAGVASTAEDMARLMLALLNPPPAFLTRESIAVMQSPQAKAPHGFIGLGFYSPVAAGGNAFVGHDGGSGGIHGTLALLPQGDFGLFVFYNSRGSASAISPEAELVRTVANRFFPGLSIPATPISSELVDGSYAPTRRSESTLRKLATLSEQLSLTTTPGGIRLRLAALPLGGVDLIQTQPGLYEGRNMEISFAPVDGTVELELGAPVARYTRISWWQSAALWAPMGAFLVLASLAVVVRWLWRLARKRRTVDNVSRAALLLELLAITGAFWLATPGAAWVAVDDPLVLPILLTIYALAWTGVTLALIGLWRWLRSPRARIRDGIVVFIALAISGFSVFWRIAGTTFQL